MAKTKISEFSSTPGNNTDIDGINIAEGCAPSGINNAIRELMSQLKDWQAGTSNDPMVIGSTGSLTLSYGTANGVAYLNGSKVLTTGSALTFTGANLGVGIATAAQRVHIYESAAATGAFLQVQEVGGQNAYFGVNTSGGSIQVAGANPLQFAINGSEQMRLTSTGLGIGTSSPGARLHVAASDSLNAGVAASIIRQGGSAGNNGLLVDVTNTVGQYVQDWRIGNSTVARLDNVGSLALGPANPSAKLDVQSASGSFGYALAGWPFLSWNNSNELNYGGISSSQWQSLKFFTAGSEKMRLTSAGDLLVGTTVNPSISGVAACHAFVQTASSRWVAGFVAGQVTPWGIAIGYGSSPNNASQDFIWCSDGTTRFSVRSNGGIANFQANNVNLSDRREKTNFAPAKSYLETICAIPVQTFNYIDQNMEDDPGLTLGVVAQDVQAVAPELVMESNWGTEEEPKMRLSIYQTDLQYALMKALQELKAEFDAYKATHP